jgi:enamine deaminase RidA (YjgF/YER057c/UK114 family)
MSVSAAAADPRSVEFKNPPALSKPNGYSHVVLVTGGKRVIVSGQTGLDQKGAIQAGFAAQVKRAFANLKTALAAVGAKPSDLVKLNYFVVGLDNDKLVALRTERDLFIDSQHPPASTLVGVQSLFREGIQIEIDAEAVLP